MPAFNERDAIAGVVGALRELPGVDIVVIDDGSGDGTATQAVRAGARVITLPFNLGIGSAVQTGFLVAQDGHYDVAVQVDGDGQHPAEELASLVQALVTPTPTSSSARASWATASTVPAGVAALASACSRASSRLRSGSA